MKQAKLLMLVWASERLRAWKRLLTGMRYPVQDAMVQANGKARYY